MKYRQKPIVIEAIKWDGTQNGFELISHQFGNPTNLKLLWGSNMRRIFDIETLEGHHEVSPGDYVIRGVKGEFYPCKPEIFEMTYEFAGV